MSAPESIIVCEGYHDRAFLRGWLVRGLSCESWVGKPYPPTDDKPVTGQGHYAFRSKTGKWLRIVPAKTDTKVTEAADTYVGKGVGNAIPNIVLTWDADEKDRETQFRNWAKKIGAVESAPFFLLSGNVKVGIRLALLVFRAPDADVEDLPAQQTLERLACAAVRDAYPDRCRAVLEWLRSRPQPPEGEKPHKTHAASHMAGWYSASGYEGFFDRIWEDAGVRAALERRLHEIGATTILESMM